MPTTSVTSFSLRRAKGADIPGLEALYRRCFAPALRRDYPPSTYVAALQALTRAQIRLVDCGTYHVAVDEAGTLLGAGGWSFANPLGTPSPIHMAHIRHFAVDPALAGQGVGSALLARSLAEAKESGARIMDCQATLGAVSFFRSHGFREIGQISVPVKPGMSYPAMRMQRRL